MRLLFRKVVRSGDLTVIDADGQPHRFGDGSGEPVAIRLHDRGVYYGLALNPALYLGEAYVDGRLTVERGSLYRLLEILFSNIRRRQPRLMTALEQLRILARRYAQYNPSTRSRANVAHHYDLNRAFFDLFLDADRQYSCAYFEADDLTLDDAQLAKQRHIAAKLVLERGHRVLDIGSGWGGLGLYLAEAAGADVTGVTLSQEQFKESNARAAASRVADQVRFELKDYREVAGSFDRIVSVGMFEHVGVGYFDAYFRKVDELLTEDGVALIHTIGRLDGPGATNPWLAKYIFPGGYVPALSEVLPSIERARLIITDIEILRLHYAFTLREWHARFQAARDRIAELYDERFCRMWEFYLNGCEATFRHQDIAVFQIQLAKDQEAVPLTRDYIGDWERSQRLSDQERQFPRRLAGE